MGITCEWSGDNFFFSSAEGSQPTASEVPRQNHGSLGIPRGHFELSPLHSQVIPIFFKIQRADPIE
jgi:hypothetical protein